MNWIKSEVTTRVLSLLAIVISLISLWLAYRQSSSDYDPDVLVNGNLSAPKFERGSPVMISVVITNTTKSNVAVYLRATTELGCLSGTESPPVLTPCEFYQSPVRRLSKTEAGKNSIKETFYLKASPPDSKGESGMSILSEPKSFIVEVINKKTSKPLFHSECFYQYNHDAQRFDLLSPALDTSQKSLSLQKECEGINIQAGWKH